MGPIRRPTGLPKNSIGSWGAENFEITNTSFKLVMMGNRSVEGNSRSLFVHTLRFRNRSAVALSTRLGTNTLTQSIWTSRLGIASASGGFCYALILVDRAARYNWAFGLQGLLSSEILSAIRKFRAAAGSLARCFYCDCDHKLFGTAISKYLVNNGSKVVAAPAKCQSSNGLVESHWKTMVHMARAYIKEKQMPCSFWFYAVVHAARMMNAIPGRHSGRLVSPFLLVHRVGQDERILDPDFLAGIFPPRL